MIPNKMAETNNNSNWKRWYSVALIGIIIIICVIGVIFAKEKILLAWSLIILTMTVFTLIVSQGVTGYCFGWLINEQKRYSLSRMQMFLWMVLILSAIIVVAFHNFPAYDKEGNLIALSIKIPKELWWAMGISTTSLVASPVILGSHEKENLVGWEKIGQTDN